MSLGLLVEALVGVRRIESFLLADEIDPNRKFLPTNDEDIALSVNDVSLNWDSPSESIPIDLREKKNTIDSASSASPSTNISPVSETCLIDKENSIIDVDVNVGIIS